MITDFIQSLTEGADLTEAEAGQAMGEIMAGQSTVSPDRRFSNGAPNERRNRG